MKVQRDHLLDVRLIEDHLFALDAKGWFRYEFLTPEWFLLLGFFTVPWIIWFFLKKRRLLVESILFGVIVMLITLLLDTVGLQFRLWEYPIEFVPVIPRAFPFDISMVPVPYMLMCQYFKTGKSFGAALVIMAASYAFIGEPFCEWLSLVHYVNWHYFYSFVYYILLGTGIRFLIIKITKYEARAQG
ncbi:CBO0543 family protein [Bacillus sp. P14.5]|uniref:CBO0543 family protein n=1 Tax=Bacillus sp. P14.5 TaxID=1983400 RepID=UPI000DEA9164|nr:CBO0543 family protein [Bacillus sp. P14.5]